MAETLTILQPGISAVTDLGRRRASRVGQMTGGASDQYSAEVANALVASEPTAPLMELMALDFAMVPSTDILVAVTGAPADVRVDGVRAAQWEPVVVPAGATLSVTRIRHGLRVYIAVHGAVHARSLMNSCAPDSVLGFGNHLASGDTIEIDVDCPPIRHPHFDIPVFRLGAARPRFGDHWDVPVTDGPDIGDFGGTETRLFDTTFTVGVASNHIGLRLAPPDGHRLPERTAATEMLSRGVPIGAVEVPAGNELLVLHRGRGVTAGYPVLAVVTTIGLSLLGQARPGHTVRFTRTGIDSAVAAHRRRQSDIDAVRSRVHTVFTALGIPTHVGPGPLPSSALTLESA
ncbi:biotin-dependent carboxyltransferase family protein [Rhodococcus sp. B10]|uniref:5-oxoprolinase subunit C family protein n=1 Tax=Rhodococcus sp. B10 TaxID=2695876 RepID=UPI0014305605|nr:biotin-dependent carboxyltransferase family protein [Rhodococcus sp. B10]NIL75598.1 protein YbgK [Rhodococcus sp. B10]